VDAEIANQSEEAQGAQTPESEVELPPAVTLVGVGGKAVVIVVPTFAEGDQGKQEVVAAVVAGAVGSAAPEVGERVDAEGAVIKERGGDGEADHQHLAGVGAEGRRPML